MKNIDVTLKYYELLMTRSLDDIFKRDLPEGFKYKFWDSDNCINYWIRIHIDTGEFNNLYEAYLFNSCNLFNVLIVVCSSLTSSKLITKQ